MKLLVFAHVPPPHHGQSFMVQQLVDHLRDHGEMREGIELFHVDARLSKSIDDLGRGAIVKLIKTIGFCLRAIWLRVRHGIDTLYYVPAPAKRGALYRDWIVMVMCRLFFRRLVFHWHAIGLGWWIEGNLDGELGLPSPPKGWEKFLTRKLLGRADLSMVLTEYSRPDAEVLSPRDIAVVPNGIPDPCEDFGAALRKRSAGSRDALFRVLYIGHCTPEKGLFDALEAVRLANCMLEGVQFRLTVAGEFGNATDRERFDSEADRGTVEYVGFLAGEQKRAALIDHDCMCFASHHESFGLVLIEAMAFGLRAVVADGHGAGELARKAGIEPQPVGVPVALADALVGIASGGCDSAEAECESSRLRKHFVENYAAEPYIEGVVTALRRLETDKK